MNTTETLKLYDFRVLHEKNPMGIDEKPYFSWKLISERQDVYQKNIGFWSGIIMRKYCGTAE